MNNKFMQSVFLCLCVCLKNHRINEMNSKSIQKNDSIRKIRYFVQIHITIIVASHASAEENFVIIT